MNPTYCPECRALTEQFARVAYCAECGWNVKTASQKAAPKQIAAIGLFVVLLLLSAVILGGLSILSWRFIVVFAVLAALSWCLWKVFEQHRRAAAQFHQLLQKFPQAVSYEPAKIDCPRCCAAAALTLGKAHCRLCGWNFAAAEKHLRDQLRGFPWRGVLGGAVGGAAAYGGFWAWGIAYGLAMILILTLLSRRAIRRELERLLADRPPEFESVKKRIAPETEAEMAYRTLRDLSRPRDVRLRRKAKLQYLAFGLVSPYFSWFLFRSLSERHLGSVSVLVVAGAHLYALVEVPREIWRGIQNRRVLRVGEVALGRVVSHRGAGLGGLKTSEITYEFQDVMNRTFQGKGDEITGKLFEEMSVLVFYDPDNPEKNVASCSTSFEVAWPGQQPFAPPLTMPAHGATGDWVQAVRSWFSGGRAGS